MIPAVLNPPAPVTNQRSTYCVMCTALGRLCPALSPLTVSPPHSNWSDSDSAKDWDGKRQKEKERREKKQKENEKART